MKTKTQIKNMWEVAVQHLEANPLTEDSLHLRRIETESLSPIYVGVDAESRLLIAVGSKTRPPRLEINSDAFDYYTSERADKSWLIILRLVDNSLSDVFATLCGDLHDELCELIDEQSIWKATKTRLILWQRLFEVAKKGVLSSNQIRGLFAELLTVRDLLHESPYDIRTIALSWNGPHGSDQDFQLPGINLEVKCIGQDASYVRISSLEQLNSEKKLYLYVINIQASNEAGALSLNELIRAIEDIISSDIKTLKIFRDALLATGFLENAYYDDPKYSLNKRMVYEVTERFPRLTRSSVPLGVDKAEYSVSLEAISPFLTTGIVYGST